MNGDRNKRIIEKIALERHTPIEKLVRLFSVPVLNAMPSNILRTAMRISSHDAASVVKHGGSTLALEGMYTRRHRSIFSRGIFQGIADLFWHHFVSQPRALRNRLRIVESLVEGEIENRHKNGEPILILNLGGGSSRALLHVVKKLNLRKDGSEIKITNIDKDARAIELSKKLAEENGLRKVFNWIEGDVRNVVPTLEDSSADIIEMVGLLDYFSRTDGIELMKEIRRVLKPGGLYVVANVHPNPEVPFVHKTGWPKMYYRNTEEIDLMLKRSGFTDPMSILLEPLGIHIIAEARK